MKRLFYILPLIGLLCSCATQQRAPLIPRTTQINKAQCDITMSGHTMHTPISMQTDHNTLVLLSIQPMMGVEAVRVEATPDSIWVYERLSRHYATLSFKEVKKMTHGIVNFRWLQRIASGERLQGKSQGLTWNFKVDGQPVSIHIYYPAIVYNETLRMKRLPSQKYKPVDIHSLLSL